MAAGQPDPEGRTATWAFTGVLLAAGGWVCTAGMGILAGLAGLWLLRRPADGRNILIAAWATALLLGTALTAPWWVAWLCSVGVLGHVTAVGLREKGTPWRVPTGVLFAAAVLVGVLWLMPAWLPAQEWVRARPFSVSLAGVAVAWTVLATAGAMGAHQGTRWLGAGLLLASVVGMGRVGFAYARADEDPLFSAKAAGALGLRTWEADWVLRGMEAHLRAGRPEEAVLLHDAAGGKEGRFKRRAAILRALAQARELQHAPPSDVDALLQHAWRVVQGAEQPAFDSWPGVKRIQLVQERLKATDRLPQALECWGGAWCVLSVSLGPPDDRGDFDASVVLVRGADAVSDVGLILQLDWDGWSGKSSLKRDGAPLGTPVRVDVHVPRRLGAHPGSYPVWMQLHPEDGGQPLRLARHPGVAIQVGTITIP